MTRITTTAIAVLILASAASAATKPKPTKLKPDTPEPIAAYFKRADEHRADLIERGEKQLTAWKREKQTPERREQVKKLTERLKTLRDTTVPVEPAAPFAKWGVGDIGGFEGIDVDSVPDDKHVIGRAMYTRMELIPRTPNLYRPVTEHTRQTFYVELPPGTAEKIADGAQFRPKGVYEVVGTKKMGGSTYLEAKPVDVEQWIVKPDAKPAPAAAKKK